MMLKKEKYMALPVQDHSHVGVLYWKYTGLCHIPPVPFLCLGDVVKYKEI
jgi:hypothetical protein